MVQEDTGEQLYHNAFATNHRLTDPTVAPIVAAGRTRWKIENENNNVLKHYGYHLDLWQFRPWRAVPRHDSGLAQPARLPVA
jgi:hypothetical protein